MIKTWTRKSTPNDERWVGYDLDNPLLVGFGNNEYTVTTDTVCLDTYTLKTEAVYLLVRFLLWADVKIVPGINENNLLWSTKINYSEDNVVWESISTPNFPGVESKHCYKIKARYVNVSITYTLLRTLSKPILDTLKYEFRPYKVYLDESQGNGGWNPDSDEIEHWNRRGILG